MDTGLKYRKFLETSRLVEKLSGVQMQQNKPIVGRTAFNHESGLVVSGVLKVPFAAETFSPDLVGQTRNIILGKKSGKPTVELKLKELGMTATEEQLEGILERVKNKSVEKKAALTGDEFLKIAKNVLK
jgi:methanogen homocitrate synthase